MIGEFAEVLRPGGRLVAAFHEFVSLEGHPSSPDLPEVSTVIETNPHLGALLLEEYPNLIYSSYDWGGGDFETAIGAGGHVGYKEMVNFLIDKGARPTLHALTMLGKTELVKPAMEAYPQLIQSLGPHGFTFLHHAKKGGEQAVELLAYFEEKGVTETKVSLYP
jgi:hypothetical protein